MNLKIERFTGPRHVVYSVVGSGKAILTKAPAQELRAVQVHLGLAGEGSDLSYEHRQSVPSDEWIVTHNLGKYPSVTVVDSAGSEVEGDVDRSLGVNQLRITFCGAFSGTAYLN